MFLIFTWDCEGIRTVQNTKVNSLQENVKDREPLLILMVMCIREIGWTINDMVLVFTHMLEANPEYVGD